LGALVCGGGGAPGAGRLWGPGERLILRLAVSRDYWLES